MTPLASRLPFGPTRPRPRHSVGVLPGSGLAVHIAEAAWPVGLFSGSCLPLAIHRGVSQVQDTQRGIWTTPPLGFGPLRRFKLGRSLCRFASPAPSVLGVSHPLNGLIPPGPCGSISRHIRPWGFVMASRAFPTRPAVPPLGGRCSLAVSASLGVLPSELGVGLRPCLGLLFPFFRFPFALPARLFAT